VIDPTTIQALWIIIALSVWCAATAAAFNAWEDWGFHPLLIAIPHGAATLFFFKAVFAWVFE
jgi:hypothetical protein